MFHITLLHGPFIRRLTHCELHIWWPNSILINKCASFTTISIILSIPCSLLFAFHCVSKTMKYCSQVYLTR